MTRFTRLAVAALLAICSMVPLPVRAQTGLTYVPLGYCQLTSLSASTLISTCSNFPVSATRAIMIPEAQAIRYRDDGTAPTVTVGQPVAVGVVVDYTGTLSKVRVIEQTSGAKLNILFYR